MGDRVRGRAPSFVEFSTGVRSWKAVLSWVAAVSREGLRLAVKEQMRFLEQNASVAPVGPDWVAMDVWLMVMF